MAVSVTTDAGTTPSSAAANFTYVVPSSGGSSGGGTSPAAPTITSLGASTAALADGDTIIVTGTNLSGATAVSFVSPASGGNPATTVPAAAFTVLSPTSISVTTPAEAAGTVDVVVQTVNGPTALTTADRLTFIAPPAPPTVTGLSTNVGSTTGRTVITISGTNFTQVTGVSFVLPASGDNPATSVAAASYTILTPTSISVVAPSAARGTYDLQVTTRGGTSAPVTADQFSFSTSFPVVTGLSAASGFGVPSGSGGDSITLYGVNLATATGVFFGGVAAQPFVVNRDLFGMHQLSARSASRSESEPRS